jgi:hypothetical protein
MRHGSQVLLSTLTLVPLLLLAPAAVRAEAGGPLDLGSLIRTRDEAALIGGLHDDDLERKVRERWANLVTKDSHLAAARNHRDLYANPSLQAYVNRLGQSLIPKEVAGTVLVSFKIVADPLPYADTLSTGTAYLSSGLISLLDNESQLAFLLMHEAGHVVLAHHLQQIIEEEKAERRASRIKTISGVAGALTGGIIGAKAANLVTGTLGVGVGASAGYGGAELGLEIAGSFQRHRFMKELQLEADQFATEALLQHGFDAREAPSLMAKIGNVVRSSGAAAELAFGEVGELPQRAARVKDLLGGAYQQLIAHILKGVKDDSGAAGGLAFGEPGQLPQRAAKLKDLLGGPYQPLVVRVLQGNGFRMSSPRYNQLMSELKRDNGLRALDSDLFVIARTNLEEAAAVRTDDPLTMYGLGMLYRTVGRTEEDSARAASYLKSAIEFDEIRHRFPEAHLQYAVELLSHEDPHRYPEIQKALRNYVALFQRMSGGALPPEMPFVYDYLDLTGDRGWIAYRVSNVSSEAPYQLTGDANIDSTPQPAAKRPSKPARPPRSAKN